MAYCAWADVLQVFPEAGDIVTAGADQTTTVDEATELADAWLSPIMRTPVQPESDAALPQMVIRITSLLAADMVAMQQIGQEDEFYSGEYDGFTFTGSKFGHRAMSYVQALRQAHAAIEDEVTPPEMSIPLKVETFTNTDGSVSVRYTAGRFLKPEPAVYLITITSSGGAVVSEDLTLSIVRDGDEPLSSSPITVVGTNWMNVEYGLQVRFVDGSGPTWTQNEYFTVTCESHEARPKTGSPHTVEVELG